MDPSKTFAESQELGGKVASLLRKRLDAAAAHYSERVKGAYKQYRASATSNAANIDSLKDCYYYPVDFVQRSILFWDTLRRRGNNYVEGAKQEVKPALKFEYDMVVD